MFPNPKIPPPSGPWTVGHTGGDSTFRDIGPDDRDEDRYGFRAFRVHVPTTRPSFRAPGSDRSELPKPGPLRIVNDERLGMLTGVYRTECYYGPGINTAACLNPGTIDHDAPFVRPDGLPHGCGFYAYGAIDHPDAQVPENGYIGSLQTFVQGVVRTSGFRVVGTKGFLSQHLRIVALAFPLECRVGETSNDRHVFDLFAPRLERIIADRYPDVAIFGSIASMVAEFPLTPLPRKSEPAA